MCFDIHTWAARPSAGARGCHGRAHVAFVVGLACALCVWFFPGAAVALTTEECLECHADADDTVAFPDGTSLVVGLDEDIWAGSTHGQQLDCTDCHASIVDYPHPEPTASSRRGYEVAQTDTCKRCHYAYYTRALDGIHYAQLKAGVAEAPVCTDCHSAHAVQSLRADPVAIDRRCARCHAEVSDTYASSVHGRALLEEGHTDVPVCTDCHGAHAIADPHKMVFHTTSHAICARCHADAERMEPYGLNPGVLDTYLDDFHGVSNKLYASGAGIPGQPMATCTDCHGVHDIQPFDRSGSAEEVRDRVVIVCRRCHEGVPPEFADAWLSHYEPTLASAPLVWGVKWAYRILIPLIMAGLVMHILLHLWRVRAQR